MHRFLWVLVVLAGCKDNGAAASEPPPAPPRKLAGVYPEAWRCESVATLEALGQLLGGTVKQIDSPMSVPRGVPRPCSYELQGESPAYWTFDIDCRDGMKQRADALFAQYRETAGEAAPCYVRVVGNDAARRLELAKLLAKNLTFENAPMSPRAFP